MTTKENAELGFTLPEANSTFLYSLLTQRNGGVQTAPTVTSPLDTPLQSGIHYSAPFAKQPPGGFRSPFWEAPLHRLLLPVHLISVVTRAPAWVEGEEQAEAVCSAPMLIFVVCEGGSDVRGQEHNVSGGLSTGLAARLPGKAVTFLPNPWLDVDGIRGWLL